MTRFAPGVIDHPHFRVMTDDAKGVRNVNLFFTELETDFLFTPTRAKQLGRALIREAEAVEARRRGR